MHYKILQFRQRQSPLIARALRQVYLCRPIPPIDPGPGRFPSRAERSARATQTQQRRLNHESKIYDFVAIGLGPFNLSLACLSAPLPGVRALFLEKSPASTGIRAC